MMHANDSAFPLVMPPSGGTEICGLTRREYFACAAMAGLLATSTQTTWGGAKSPEDLAVGCVKLADAILAALSESEAK